MAKVTGIGGIFFKARDDDSALSSWYQKCLGIEPEDFGGAILNWSDDTAEDGGMTVWCLGKKDTEWFSPSDSGFMVNYRVDDMDGMIERLTSEGVDVLQGPEAHENGRFLWIMDPDGNKVELWEPKIWDEKNKTS